MTLCQSMQCSIFGTRDMFLEVSASQVFDVIAFCSVLLPSTVFIILFTKIWSLTGAACMFSSEFVSRPVLLARNARIVFVQAYYFPIGESCAAGHSDDDRCHLEKVDQNEGHGRRGKPGFRAEQRSFHAGYPSTLNHLYFSITLINGNCNQ